MQKYLLPCSCGKANEVVTSQAGETLVCQCGKSLEVPTLRGLRELEAVQVIPASAGSSAVKSLIFVLGLLLLVGGGVASGYFLVQRSLIETERPDTQNNEQLLRKEIGKMSPYQTLVYWDYLKKGIGYRETPEFELNQRKAADLLQYGTYTGALALLGVALMVGANLIKT